MALAIGGTHSVDNLTGACKSCNSGKQTAGLLQFMLRQVQNTEYLTGLAQRAAAH